MKIMVVMYSMMAGGAERVAATLANHWATVGDELILVTITSSETDFYEVDRRITRIALGLSRPSRNWREFFSNNVQLVMRLRELMRRIKPDVVLSFIDVMAQASLL